MLQIPLVSFSLIINILYCIEGQILVAIYGMVIEFWSERGSPCLEGSYGVPLYFLAAPAPNSKLQFYYNNNSSSTKPNPLISFASCNTLHLSHIFSSATQIQIYCFLFLLLKRCISCQNRYCLKLKKKHNSWQDFYFYHRKCPQQ